MVVVVNATNARNTTKLVCHCGLPDTWLSKESTSESIFYAALVVSIYAKERDFAE